MPSQFRRILTGALLVMIPFLAIPDPPRQVFAGGQFVQFPINSLHKYRNGMELNNWTRVRVRVDGLTPTTNWRYIIYALDEDMIGDMPPNKLDLDYLKIQVVLTSISGFTIITADTAPTDLSQIEHIFVTGQGNGEFELLISYKLGIDPLKPLLGERPDFYNVDLEFRLESDIP
ncbi:MAG: hypothetical protein ACK4VN_02265 [Bacteroidales bacterium]